METEAMVDLLLHWSTLAIEVTGILVIVIGAIVATASYLESRIRRVSPDRCYHKLRAGLGRSILLGLEFLVAADIIETVAIEPSMESVLVLGGIVLIRTFLSFALEIEIEGKLPWRPKQKTANTPQ